MAVNVPPIGQLYSVPGVRVGVTSAGIRYADRDDFAVFELARGTVVAGVFTRNRFKAAPVVVAESRRGFRRAMVVNSGNANAATGNRGIADAEQTCAWVAEHIGCAAEEVLPFSTGVIGEFLPMSRVRVAAEDACGRLTPDGWNAAAAAIMTTDTVPKGVSSRFSVAGRTVTATGIVKGSGMIRPDMATLLSFLACDAALTPTVADQLILELADGSFNRLTVDGDTSTNDSFVLAATGQSGVDTIAELDSAAYRELRSGLLPLVEELAVRTVRDAEGATKFVTVTVTGGRTERECLQVAYTIANSPLVKTALFAGDPNWGRFCMAIGRAGIDDLDQGVTSLHLDDVVVAQDGLVADSYVERDAAAVMAQDEFTVNVGLGRGHAEASVWTSDLSYEYIKINAEYRS